MEELRLIMSIRNLILASSLTLVVAASACQSTSSGDAPVAGASGAGGRATGSGGQGAAASAGAAGTAGSAANAGAAGEFGGASAGGALGSGGASAGSGGASAGADDGGRSGSSESGGATADGGSPDDGGASGSGAQTAREFAYVSGLFAGVFVCAVDPRAGTPQLFQTAAIGNKQAVGVLTDPLQRFVYVTTSGGIEVYRIAADGNLPSPPASSTPGVGLPTIEPSGRFLYAASGTSIAGFEIDAATGALSAVGEPVPVGVPPDFASPTFLAADPTGNFLYVSSGKPGVRGYRIDRNSGALSELAGSPFGATGLPAGDGLQTGAIVFKPSGDFLYTGGALLNSGGALNGFAIDRASGKLTLLAGSPFSFDLDADDYNTNMAMDPQGEYLYVTSAFQREHVSGFRIDQVSGSLEQVPGSPLQVPSPYGIAVDPSGRFVYVGTDSGQTAVYAIRRADGGLIKHPDSPFQFGGLQPEISFATLP
jgi:6-phosphogluconolactonase (cycloisomerase 2 family)